MQQMIHRFKDGTANPEAKQVPAKIMARLEQILAEAKQRKQASKA